MLLCIVVPAYNEEAMLTQTYQELSLVLNTLIKQGEIARESFICFVDDGSKDKTWEILKGISQNESTSEAIAVSAIKLSRNYGHQNALLAGLEYVADKCDCAISIDCDLQDDVGVIGEFVKKQKQVQK
ncbi:glycosyltransferase [Helicobacter japonicus]|uniref:glycosyltransferase n=1 Tax=Helicobacter japonicus TaxID=425400 RepID=UPI0023F49F1A|nr:glycosyltransferase [Helicobacter japonicus]